MVVLSLFSRLPSIPATAWASTKRKPSRALSSAPSTRASALSSPSVTANTRFLASVLLR
jgi:hypothetical protein